MKVIYISIILLIVSEILPFSQNVADNPDKEKITKVIETFSEGIDTQNATMIENVFAKDVGLFATSPDGKNIITMPAAQFAKLHGEGKFGGRARTLEIEYLDVTDNLVATAKVIASDEKVHYTYYLSFFKNGEHWLIQTMLQRSKMKSS